MKATSVSVVCLLMPSSVPVLPGWASCRARAVWCLPLIREPVLAEKPRILTERFLRQPKFTV
jgi:hypothetical protein